LEDDTAAEPGDLVTGVGGEFENKDVKNCRGERRGLGLELGCCEEAGVGGLSGGGSITGLV